MSILPVHLVSHATLEFRYRELKIKELLKTGWRGGHLSIKFSLKCGAQLMRYHEMVHRPGDKWVAEDQKKYDIWAGFQSVNQKNSDFVWADADELLMLFPPQSGSRQIENNLRKHVVMLRCALKMESLSLMSVLWSRLGIVLFIVQCEAPAVEAESPPFIPLVEHEITGHVQPKLLLRFCFHRCFNEATCRRH